MTAGAPLITSIVADASRLLGPFSTADEEIRVGIDVVSISAFERIVASKRGDAFLRTRFTKGEQSYCEGLPERLAARWAAKEAVAKAIGTGFRGLRPSQIEVVNEPWGEPSVRTTGSIWPHGADKWRWAVSMAHDGDAAVAIALAVAIDRGRVNMGGGA